MSFFEHISATDDSERVANRKAAAVAAKRFDTQFGAFVKGASSNEEFNSRVALIEDELNEMVEDVVEEHGGNAREIRSYVKEAILGPLVNELSNPGSIAQGFSDAAGAVQNTMADGGQGLVDGVQNAAQSLPNPGGVANSLPGAGPVVQGLQGTGIPGMAQDAVRGVSDFVNEGNDPANYPGPSGQPSGPVPMLGRPLQSHKVAEEFNPAQFGEEDLQRQFDKELESDFGSIQPEDIITINGEGPYVVYDHDGEGSVLVNTVEPSNPEYPEEGAFVAFLEPGNFEKVGSHGDADPLVESSTKQSILGPVGDAIGDGINAAGDVAGLPSAGIHSIPGVGEYAGTAFDATLGMPFWSVDQGTSLATGHGGEGGNPSDGKIPPTITPNAIPEGTMPSGSMHQDPVVRQGASRIARRPKMCPYHNELTDASLQAGEPQYAAFSGLVGGPSHCKGEFDGKCNFKPEMVSQSYWDGKAQEAQERKQQREQEAQEINSIPEAEVIQEPEVLEEGDGVTELNSDMEDAPSAVGEQPFNEAIEHEPMALAASKDAATQGTLPPGIEDHLLEQTPTQKGFLTEEEYIGLGLEDDDPTKMTPEQRRNLKKMEELKYPNPEGIGEAGRIPRASSSEDLMQRVRHPESDEDVRYDPRPSRPDDTIVEREVPLIDLLNMANSDPVGLQKLRTDVNTYSEPGGPAVVPYYGELARVLGTEDASEMSVEEANSVFDAELMASSPNRTGRVRVLAATDWDGGGAVKREKLPTGNKDAQGGPSPEIDKKQWKPGTRDKNGTGNLKPVDSEMEGTPNPTIQQTLWEIRDTQHVEDWDASDEPAAEMNEEVVDLPSANDDGHSTEKNVEQDMQGGTFDSGGNAANPVTNDTGKDVVS